MSDYNVVSGNNQIPFQNKANTNLLFKRFIDLEPFKIKINAITDNIFALPNFDLVKIDEYGSISFSNYEKTVNDTYVEINTDVFKNYLNTQISDKIVDKDVLRIEFLEPVNISGLDTSYDEYSGNFSYDSGNIYFPINVGELFEIYVKMKKELIINLAIITTPTTPPTPDL